MDTAWPCSCRWLMPAIVFARRALPIVLLATLAVAALVALYAAAQVLLILFGALLFAILLRAFSEGLSHLTGLSVGWSLAVVVLLLFGLAGLTGWLVAPGLAEQFEELKEQLPEAARRIEEFLQRLGWRERALTGEDGILEWLEEEPERLAEIAGQVLTGAAGAIAWLAIMFFVGIYFAINPRLYVDGVIRLAPPRRRARAAEVMEELGTTLRWWLITRVVSMTAVGVLTTVMLAVLGVPLAVLLGLVAFVLTFVPYLGPIAATIPIAVVALAEGADLLVYAVVLYTLIQSLEGFVIMPMAQDRLVHLPPAATLISEVLMGAWFGLVGVVFATPLAAALLPLVKRIYLEDTLGDTGATGARS
jgi:predicted PurR-regulated permease PerM